MVSQLYLALDTLKDQAKDALWAVSSCVCQQSAKVKINGRTCAFVDLHDWGAEDVLPDQNCLQLKL